ncbi:MAG: dienelactone hydrolase family protein, partial [Acidimicrobiales bacterium]
ILFHFGGSDPYISNEQIEAVREAFASREDVRFVVQPEAGHAFENLHAPQFANPEAASRSWGETVTFLGEVLR